MKVLSRASFRQLLQHPGQTFLALAGIALGVAVVVSINLTQASAEQSFTRSTNAVVGRATHQIVGGPDGVDENLYVQLRLAPQTATHVAPFIEARVTLPELDTARLRLIGIDPLAENPIRDAWQVSNQSRIDSEIDLGALMRERGTVLIAQDTATRLGVAVGDNLVLDLGSRVASVRVVGLLAPRNRLQEISLDELIVADIATAQELLDFHGRLSRIDLRLDRGTARDTDAGRELGQDSPIAAVKSRLGPGVELITSAARTAAVANMTTAFYTNLQALSFLALLVGMFLIYNSQTFLIVQRRAQLGILRALGVTRKQIAWALLLEALMLGLAGAILGVVLGVLLAQQLLGMVTQTVSDLYFGVGATTIELTPWLLTKGIGLGVMATVAATLPPLREAATIAPRAALARSDLESKWRHLVRRSSILGLLSLAAGGLVLTFTQHSVIAGFAGLALIMIGCAFLIPGLTRLVAAIVQPLATRVGGVVGRLTVRTVTAALSRTSVAIAALMVAIASTIAVSLMIESFRNSVSDWLETAAQADFYLSATPVSSSDPGANISPTIVDALRTQPGVEAVSTIKRFQLVSAKGIDTLAVYELTPQARAGFRLLAQASPEVWAPFETEDAVLVTESYAFHHQVTLDQRLALRTEAGARPFRVVAIYQDYSSETGLIMMSRNTYRRHWRDDAVTGIGLYTSPNISVDAVRQMIQSLPDAGLEIVSNRDIRLASMAIFDRTFAITEVLRSLAGLIAFVGILSALMAIQLERTRELGVLKAIGFTPRQIRTMVICETGFMGVIAGLFALPVGILMGWCLAFVINRRSFGWTMEFNIDPTVLGSGLLLAVVAALAAGLYPAARMAGTAPAIALRAE